MRRGRRAGRPGTGGDLDVDFDFDFDFNSTRASDVGHVEQAVDAEAIARKVEAATRDVHVDAIVARRCRAWKAAGRYAAARHRRPRRVGRRGRERPGSTASRRPGDSIEPESAAAKRRAGRRRHRHAPGRSGRSQRPSLDPGRRRDPRRPHGDVEYLRGGHARSGDGDARGRHGRRGMAFRGRDPGDFDFRMGEPTMWMGPAAAGSASACRISTPQLAQYFGVEGRRARDAGERGTPAGACRHEGRRRHHEVQDQPRDARADVTRAVASVRVAARSPSR